METLRTLPGVLATLVPTGYALLTGSATVGVLASHVEPPHFAIHTRGAPELLT